MKAKEALKWYRDNNNNNDIIFGNKNNNNTILIDTHFHLINPEQNEITDNEQSQIDVLNDAYLESGFQFNLTSIHHYTNDDWWVVPLTLMSEEEREMKAQTRIGGCDTLNVWFTNLNTLGWSYFASDCDEGQELDGVVVLHSSGMGGSQERFNEGDTLVHEVGHWMGLFHTFCGFLCSGENGGGEECGDMVADTPAVLNPNYECNKEMDSCPFDGQGLDLVENYMDYTDDACLDSFTPGQYERMQAEWNAHRDPTRSVEFKLFFKSAADTLKKNEKEKSLFLKLISKSGLF